MSISSRISAALQRFAVYVRSFQSNLTVTGIEIEEEMPTAQELAGYILHADGSTSAPQSAITRRSDAQHREREQEQVFEAVRAAGQVASAGGSGGRVSVESQADIRFSTGVSEFIEMNTDDGTDIFDYSETYIRGLRQAKLLEMLTDASPEMSRAFFDFLLMCCPGWELRALNKSNELDTKGQEVLDECVSVIRSNYKAPEVLFSKYFLSVFLRGAMASELVLNKRGTEFIDIAIIDPDSIEHHRYRDPLRGMIWKIYQRQGMTLADLNIPRVGYIPLHAYFNSNRGRPIARPAVFVCFFLIATLQDLRRVIRQQGYPRIDISVSIEKLKSLIPAAKAVDAAAIKKLGNDVVAEVKAMYKALKPDDTFIHTEVVTVNQPVGTLNANSLGVVDGLLKALERMATRALKTMPLLMATTDGVSEANANRQWEIHVAGIKSIQHMAESLLEDHFDLVLRARGVQAKAQFRFSELRAAEMLRDAQVEQLKTVTARAQYENGTISADEMALKSAGKKKADQQKPRSSGTTGTAPNDTNADPGSNRVLQMPSIEEMVRMTLEQAKDAKELFETYAPEQAKALLSAEEE